MNKKPHEDHRSRLRHRFRQEGLDYFEDHQILELLLFYAIPRRDVNPLAHRLLERFGSLSGVLEADFHQLISVPGVGENTATLLTILPGLCRAYLMDKDTCHPSFADRHKLGSYLVHYFVGKTKEVLIAVLLNNRGEMIDTAVISEGTVNKTDTSLRLITEAAYARRAASVVLAHNHPDGTSEPSNADITLTREISSLLSKLSIPLVEHFVVAGHRYTGICHYTNTGIALGLDGLKELCMGAPVPEATDS